MLVDQLFDLGLGRVLSQCSHDIADQRDRNFAVATKIDPPILVTILCFFFKSPNLPIVVEQEGLLELGDLVFVELYTSRHL